MTNAQFVRRGIAYYWRTHLAVAAGVAVAVAVLAGALVVGNSVRASLQSLALERIGRTEHLVSSQNFFREKLATGVPLIALNGIAVHDSSGRRASGVAVYGVDERFWNFHERQAVPPQNRELLMSSGLARELGAKPDDSIRIQIGKPSPIPAESLHGRKDDSVRTTRFTFRSVLHADAMGDFSLQPKPGVARSVFVSLQRLQRDLEQEGHINAFLAGSPPEAAIRSNFELEDIGLKLRGNILESKSMMLSDPIAATVMRLEPTATPVFTYLANTIRSPKGEIPYSLMTAIGTEEGVGLNEWAYRELKPAPGDPIDFEYYMWDTSGRLVTKRATLPFRRVLPMSGLGGDRELAPEYPGISDTKSLSDWNPPFPMDLSRIRKTDEAYWDRYRTAPKAFISLAEGQKLWGSRFGRLTSIRTRSDIAPTLKRSIDPLQAGFLVTDVRRQSAAASGGTTDFGEYFTYFSFFLVVSALLLAGLFFRFGIEARSREIGLLRSVGFPPAHIARLMLSEGLLVALGGALLGLLGALLYAGLIVWGLATWWQTDLRLHISAAPMLFGFAGGMAVALLFLLGSLRALRGTSSRELMAGGGASTGRWHLPAAIGTALAGGVALFAPPPFGFFAAAGFLLVAALLAARTWLGRPRGTVQTSFALGLRATTSRPGRSVLCIALIAFASFTIVAVDAFRRDDSKPDFPFKLIGESQLPIFQELGPGIVPLRIRTGDDLSCLNLYQPQRPRVLAAPKSLGWTALEATPGDGIIPALVDANSLEYTLHAKVGDVRVFEDGLKVRFVGTLRDSVFQSEIIVSEANFLRTFPNEQGFRMFLLNVPNERIAALEEDWSDYGLDITTASERLATYHRVENMYLSTFQALGALGLLLGTVGLAAVLLRNLLERRREIALLRAVGFNHRDLTLMVLAENAFLLLSGLAIGTASAALAVAPQLIRRGGGIPVLTIGVLPLAVLTLGLIVSFLAARNTLRAPLIESLRAD